MLSTDGQAWARAATFSVDARAGTLTAALGTPAATVVGVRFDWEGYPQCALYNGAPTSGPDDHMGIAAPPFSHTPPPPTPKAWQPVFRQTLPDLFTPGQWSRDPTQTDAPTFSDLAGLEQRRDPASKGFELKLRWVDPDGTETLRWKQTTNPLANKSKTVEGFELLGGPGKNFGGLAYNGAQALLDGQPGSGNWFFAVGGARNSHS